ncbi:MAB_1171c family putative transporter [Streptomyces sp. NPDC001135]
MVISDLRELGVGLETAGVVSMWLAVALRAPAAVRSSEQRPLWLAVLGAAAAVTLHLPWVNDLVYQAMGPTHLTALARNLFGILTSALVLDFLSLAVRGRHTYLLYGVAGLVMTTLVWLDVIARPHLQHAIPPHGQPTPSTAYWAVLITANLGTNVVCATACLWYSRASQDRTLRVGLRLFALSAAFSGAYWLLSATYVAERYAWIPSISRVLLACYAFSRASVICVPLGAAAALTLRRLHTVRKLWPLWRDLVDAVPDVRLAQTRERRLGFLRYVNSLDLLLYRTLIEIRDAILHLRAYVPQAVVDEIRARLEHEDPRPTEADARLTACWLRVARHAKASGAPPLHGDLTVPVLGGTDLPGEIEFLCEVAEADTSPRIRELTARLDHRVAAQ